MKLVLLLYSNAGKRDEKSLPNYSNSSINSPYYYCCMYEVKYNQRRHGWLLNQNKVEDPRGLNIERFWGTAPLKN